MKKAIGLLLIIAGILGFVFSSVTFTTTEEVADVGPVEVEKKEEKTVPIGPIASGITLVAGIALVGFSMRSGSAKSH